MYVTAVNEAYALDARSGREIWHYSRPRSQGLGGRRGRRHQSRRGRARRSRLHGHRQRAPVRAASLHRPAHLGRRDGRFPPELRRHQRAAGGQRPGDRRRLRRRRRRPRIPRCLQGLHRRARLALLDHSRARASPARKPGSGRALEHGCGATWLTGTYDPEAHAALLAHRQSLSRLQRRRAQGRQPVHGLGAGARPGHREAEMVLPVHAARPARLGRHRNAGAGGRDSSTASRAS